MFSFCETIIDTKDVISALTGLAQDSRLAIFRRLVQCGPEGMTPGVMSKEMGISPSALSFHLKELSHANLVCACPCGRSIVYSVNFETMNSLLSFLSENCCSGVPCN